MTGLRVDDFSEELLAHAQDLAQEFRLVLDARDSSNFGPAFQRLINSCSRFQETADIPLRADTEPIAGTSEQDLKACLDWAITQMTRLRDISQSRDAASVASVNLSAAVKLLEGIKTYEKGVSAPAKAPTPKAPKRIVPIWEQPVLLYQDPKDNE